MKQKTPNIWGAHQHFTVSWEFFLWDGFRYFREGTIPEYFLQFL